MHVQLCAPDQAYDAATAAMPQPLREYHLAIMDNFDMTISPTHYYAGLCRLLQHARAGA